jgi:hypothetical protein
VKSSNLVLALRLATAAIIVRVAATMAQAQQPSPAVPPQLPSDTSPAPAPPASRYSTDEMKVGDIIIYNVRGGVAPFQGSLLLGLSFLERFETWSIDNKRHKLILGPQQAFAY